MNQRLDLDAAPAADHPDGLVPFLPAPTLPTPSSPEPVAFDAAAMVESQRVGIANPEYGVLPNGTDAGRDAANELRAQAQKKRRHNKRLGQMVVVAMFIGMAGVGYLVFRAFQDGQVEEAEATTDIDADGDVVALTPTGQQSEINQAVGDLNSVTPGESGGLIGAIDAARDLTQGIAPAPTNDGQAAAEPLPNQRIALHPEFRTIDYTVRVYDGAQPGATFRNFDVTYDTRTDNYYGYSNNTATDGTELVSFDGAWRYTIGPDGLERRVKRSEFSRSPEPDTPLAELLAEADVFPSAARPFATLVSEDATSEIGLDGSTLTAYSYVIDVAGFRAADPASYATWRTLWATAPHDIIDLIEPGTEQIRRAEPHDTPAPEARPLDDWSALELVPSDNRSAVLFLINEQGVVELASLVSPEDDLRIVYAVRGYGDQSARLRFPKDSWVDAP